MLEWKSCVGMHLGDVTVANTPKKTMVNREVYGVIFDEHLYISFIQKSSDSDSKIKTAVPYYTRIG